jgi:hypothetical protein
VRRLDERGRVDELARMLGGEAITDGLRRSAREMLVERTRGVGQRDAVASESERAKGESPENTKDTKGTEDTKGGPATKGGADTKGTKATKGGNARGGKDTKAKQRGA